MHANHWQKSLLVKRTRSTGNCRDKSYLDDLVREPAAPNKTRYLGLMFMEADYGRRKIKRVQGKLTDVEDPNIHQIHPPGISLMFVMKEPYLQRRTKLS